MSNLISSKLRSTSLLHISLHINNWAGHRLINSWISYFHYVQINWIQVLHKRRNTYTGCYIWSSIFHAPRAIDIEQKKTDLHILIHIHPALKISSYRPLKYHNHNQQIYWNSLKYHLQSHILIWWGHTAHTTHTAPHSHSQSHRNKTLNKINA